MKCHTAVEQVASLIEYELRSNASPLQVAISLAEHNMLALDRIIEKMFPTATVNSVPVHIVEPQVSPEVLGRIAHLHQQQRSKDGHQT